MEPKTTLTLLAASLGLGYLCVRLLRRSYQTVNAHEVGLLYRHGRFLNQVGPGLYFVDPLGGELKRIDTREQLHEVSGQEILTQDNVPVRLSLSLRLRVVDAQKRESAVANWQEAVHLSAQMALRDGLSALAFEDLVANRRALDEGLNARLKPLLSALGIEVIEARLRDFTVSSELRQAFGQVAKARAEAKARLEQTRGETANLRAMANAARLLHNTAGLAQLRWLQTAEACADKPGNQLVLKLDAPWQQSSPGAQPASDDSPAN